MVRCGIIAKRVSVAIAVIALSGCATSASKVLEHVNNREYYFNRYIEECVQVKGPDTCEAFQKEVNRYKEVVLEAEAANARGGKYPLQLKELKLQQKKVKDARGSRGN